jgi:hypothetical protein
VINYVRIYHTATLTASKLYNNGERGKIKSEGKEMNNKSGKKGGKMKKSK